jgi:hypothetical protein
MAASASIIFALTGAMEWPSPVISVVMPWVILLAARLSTRTLNSDWPSMSMKPGATTSLPASMRRVAFASFRSPMAAMRSPRMPTSARYQGAPVPSTIRPLAKTRSKGRSSGIAATATAATARTAIARIMVTTCAVV